MSSSSQIARGVPVLAATSLRFRLQFSIILRPKMVTFLLRLHFGWQTSSTLQNLLFFFLSCHEVSAIFLTSTVYINLYINRVYLMVQTWNIRTSQNSCQYTQKITHTHAPNHPHTPSSTLNCKQTSNYKTLI